MLDWLEGLWSRLDVWWTCDIHILSWGLHSPRPLTLRSAPGRRFRRSFGPVFDQRWCRLRHVRRFTGAVGFKMLKPTTWHVSFNLHMLTKFMFLSNKIKSWSSRKWGSETNIGFEKRKEGNLLSNRIGLMVPVWCMFICGYVYIFVLCWSVGRHGRDWLFCGRRVRLALVLWIWGCCYQPSKKTKELRLKNPRILIGSCPDINISLLNS